MQIKSMHLTDFKGVRDATYSFSAITKIMAANGKGKTTIATAWYWLLCDKDYSLKSNPNIVPIGVEECLPRVEAVLDINGKAITIAKQQKISKKKPDDNGVVAMSSSNVYEINNVPKTERDFKSYLEDEGINFELFLALSHPNVFTGQKASDMRKILFKMASEKSDYDIASADSSMEEVAKLLVQYKFDEIEAMHKASKKKADEQTKAIPNQIIGLEKAKVDTDTAELELEKAGLQKQINEKEKLLEDNKTILDEYQKATDGIIELKFEMSTIEREATEKLAAERKVIQSEIDNAGRDFSAALQDQKMIELDIERWQGTVKRNNEERSEFGNQYEAKKNEQFDFSQWEFDETSAVCKMCGRPYEDEKISEVKAEFEKRKQDAIEKFNQNKKEVMNSLIQKANTLKESTSKIEKEIEQFNLKIKELKADKIRLNKEKTIAAEKLSRIPVQADLSGNQVYQEMQLKLSNMENALDSMNNGASYRNVINDELSNLREELSAVEAKIAKASNNIDIDEQISALQEKQLEYEQAKADSEKILYQLDLLSKRKNELLVEEINNHFGIVKWQLFEFQKNGGYKEICVPLVDGKRFGDSTNTGKEIVAKLDIANSLQKFFGMSVPVFLDNAESLNDFNLPEMDCQLITMSVVAPLYKDELGEIHKMDKKYNPEIHALVYDGSLKVEAA